MTPRCLPALMIGIAVLAACSPPPPPTAQTRADQATLAACRQRADAVFAQQNRGALFLGDGSDRFSPESASYQSGITTRGLATRFGWDNQVSDCIRNQGSTGGTEGAAAGAPIGSGTAPMRP